MSVAEKMEQKLKQDCENAIKSGFFWLKKHGYINDILQFFKAELEAYVPAIKPIADVVEPVIENIANETPIEEDTPVEEGGQ